MDLAEIYLETKDILLCRRLIQEGSVAVDESIKAKVDLLQYIHQRIAYLTESRDEFLPTAKKLLSSLSITDDMSIVSALEGVELTSDALEYVEAGALSAVLLRAIVTGLSRREADYASVTQEKLFPSVHEETGNYSGDVVRRIVDSIERQNWEGAFGALLEAEPSIPRNLHVSRMHKPLLQKYIFGSLLSAHRQVNSLLDTASLSLSEQICQRDLTRRYPCFSDKMLMARLQTLKIQ